MKLSTIIALCAGSEAAKARRSQDLFDEFFGNSVQKTTSTTSASDMLYQIFGFYFGMSGNFDFSLLDNALSYGCWCQIRNVNASSTGIVQGKGQPVDALDQICKAWQQCRSCNEVDHPDGDCDPNNVSVEVGFDPVTMRIECDGSNETACAKNNCKCDDLLAFELNQLLPQMDTQFITNSDGSGFDHVNECKAAGGNSSGNSGGNGYGNANQDNGSQCCGEYPNRFTFNPLGGERACCGDVTYNTEKRECCNNSFLASIGSCQ